MAGFFKQIDFRAHVMLDVELDLERIAFGYEFFLA